MTNDVYFSDRHGRTPRPNDIPVHQKGEWTTAPVTSVINEVPIGMMMMYACNSTPGGPGTWLACDGTSYPTATYPALFALTAYIYGGAGANFKVPDTRGLIIAGATVGGTLLGANGAVAGPSAVGGGEYAHLLAGNESGSPPHSHTVTDPGHAHSAQGSVGGAVVQNWTAISAPATNNFNIATTTNATGVTVNNSTLANAVLTHNNVQPYIAIPYWIRAL